MMKKTRISGVNSVSVRILCVWGAVWFLLAATVPAFAQISSVSSPETQIDQNRFVPSSPAQAAREKAKTAEDEAYTARQEAEIQKKTVEIERQKAQVKLKEAEAAKQEAKEAISKAGDTQKIQEALSIAQQKEQEALLAFTRVKAAQEKMNDAQNAARLSQEKLILARQQASSAEEALKRRQSIMYRKLFQTSLVFLIGYILILVFGRIVNRRIHDLKIRHIVRKNVIYFLSVLVILYTFFIWVQDINSFTLILSVIGAGVALALQEVLLCIAGWFLLLIRHPFEVGDRIELNGVRGDVIDIRLFQTSLLEIGNWVEADQSTGRIVHIPNSTLFKRENYNYSRGFEFIWNEIKILVTFESNWKRAEEIMMRHGVKEDEGMEEVVKRKIHHMTRQYMIYYQKLTPIVYANIKESGVELTLRYLTEARQRRPSQDRLCRAILEDFGKEPDVTFAYTTYRFVK